VTPEQHDHFEATGLLRLPGAIDPGAREAMLDRVWAALRARHGFRRDDPQTWKNRRPGKLKNEIDRAGGFPELECPVLVDILDTLLGVGVWKPPDRWAVPILGFPAGARWALPHRFWHLDLPAPSPPPPLTTLVVLTLLERVEPRGGGTTVVEGSSRLVERLCREGEVSKSGRSVDVRRALRRIDPWFHALWQEGGEARSEQLFAGTVVRGVPLRVRELTGEPGDVVVMHPWTLHSISANSRSVPRLALSTHVHTSAGGAPVVRGTLDP